MSKRTKWESALSGGTKQPRNRRITYEEKVEKVKEVQAKFPNATRTTINNYLGYKSYVLDEMEAKGDIKLPPKRKTTSRSTSWMNTLGKLSGR